MKKLTLIILTFFGVVINNDLKAQTAKAALPSDVSTGYTYDFNSAQRIIIERQVKPSVQNQDAQAIIDVKDFPKLTNKDQVNDAYLETLKLWMEKNPSVIIESLKSRKEIVQQY